MSSIPLDPALPLRNSLARIKTPPKPDFSQENGALEASRDARQIVRLVQCASCSYPLQEPVTLPCGNSICKNCIPELRLRPNISYPATPNRLQGFTCPFPTCKMDHAAGDVSVDVVLKKVMYLISKEIDAYANSDQASKILFRLQERDKWSIAGVPSLRQEEARTRVLSGGRLIATYTMAQMGELPYDSEVMYTSISATNEQSEALDTAVLEHLQESIRAELDCQVCYNLFLEPYTTPCGHTFCRSCLYRVLDHSRLCPICRRVQTITPQLGRDRDPSNVIISKLLTGLCPEALAVRAKAAEADLRPGTVEMDIPLFICTLSFPQVPTFLHIFEPRYRLMIRRAIESGEGKFGMLRHNPSREPQGELGRVSFYEYGTLLCIEGIQVLPDGRSLIETRGKSRFRVLKHGTLDGYTIGKIELLTDISIPAEEELEARETTDTRAQNLSAQSDNSAPLSPEAAHIAKLNAMSTKALFELGVAFVKKMRDRSAPWLHARVLQAYGECPNDPAIFPWWFASVFPTADSEKYHLLMTDSVRQRLKIIADWIAVIEAGELSQDNGCNVL
ncbi:uncharacterized protein L3040_004412 [Drepanopeziza brunnea f. sp. 'multigermtubi']|uniref:Putative ATP-dependent protease (CrgA) n=1 Tax=Marssonina brunnea f. sp. multigermtubi (strain MB_m1) TaxID=1072389 RepID=K1XYF7_MARBU|nr:putative ATP-dependent protease (CrgA) [Drepanopeziza brunnea f. sp. 'multigermtubi' MB_m1]EKD17874.1 putative ATP-dependent protease (CrgA) [Drepanopeziza brunnea f. sp. 'multigermtubi' MB_m1]KAJ5043024.1 hypothetical protein L3040_004412 [Drepanopeziza brunnea f. sp. 'multigermtubi']